MTPPLYTDQDIRSEAAHCLLALSSLPSVPDILRWLPGAYVDSYREDDGSGQTWGDVLDNDGLATVARQIHELITAVMPLPFWAVNLHADGLEPSNQHVINIGWNDGPLQARIHIAFPADTPPDERDQFVTDISDAIAGTVPVR